MSFKEDGLDFEPTHEAKDVNISSITTNPYEN